ncbi:MAG: hypothetical protein M3530_03275 [Thermoproteota archaeon]|nr:hypothetical protein [Thermoproteota archaeon]
MKYAYTGSRSDTTPSKVYREGIIKHNNLFGTLDKENSEIDTRKLQQEY